MAREEEEYEQKQMEWKKREREQAYKDVSIALHLESCVVNCWFN